MSARLFRRIKSSFFGLNKTLLFTAVVLFSLVLVPLKTFADAPDATTQSNFSTYLNLFDAPGSGITIPSGGALVKDVTTNAITGLKVNISLGFTSADKDTVQKRWDHVKNDTITGNYTDNESFLIRVCDNNIKTNCWINNVPYYSELNDRTDLVNVLTAQKNGDPKQSTSITNFSLLGAGAAGIQWKYQRASGKNEGTVSDFNSFTFTKGSTVEATLWYCANNVDGEKNGKTAYQNSNQNDNIATFDDLCGGGSYFRIGSPITISIPTDDTTIQNQTNNQQSVTTSTAVTDNLPKCGLVPGGGGTINGCLSRVAYGIYWLAAALAGLFGKLFDFFVGYSLSDKSYRYDFAVTGWKLVRDISNIFFIIILVWTGFSAVFNTKTNMKSVVSALIINALLINFSLFFTRVVIDISNVTARMFYSEMVVCDSVNIQTNGNCDPAQARRTPQGYWPLSEKIVSAFNPQKLFQASVLQNANSGTSSGNSLNVDSRAAGQTVGDSETAQANYFMIVCLVAAVIMFFVAVMFFKITFLFVGRVVGLYMCMIFAPFAFLSRDIPLLGKMGQLQWSSWKKDLTNYAMLAPVFLAFLYIIYSFLSTDFVKQIGYSDSSGNFFGTAMGVGIPLAIIFFFLNAAQSAAKDFSGRIGNQIAGFGEKATSLLAGTALGIATGGAALAGTAAAGLTKGSEETRTRLQAQRAAGGWRGRIAGARLQAADWTQKQSFDARGTRPIQLLNKTFGLNTNNAAVSALGFGAERTQGGRKAQIERAEKKTKDEINEISSAFTNDADAAKFWQEHLKTGKMQKVIEREAQELYKEKYGKYADKTEKGTAEFAAQKQTVVDGYGKVENNKQLTQALRVNAAQTVLNKKIAGVNPESSIARALGFTGATIAGAGLAGAVPLTVLTAGALTDNVGKRRAAQSILKAQAKAVKDAKTKRPREERLKDENVALGKKLDAIEKTLEGTYRLISEENAELNPLIKSKTEAEKKDWVEKEVTRLKSKESADDAAAAVARHKELLKNQYDRLDLDVKRLDSQYTAAIKSGERALSDDLEKQLNVAIASRNAADAKSKTLDLKEKRDIENNINRNDAELEKISDKNKAAEAKKPDEPKK